MHIGEAMIHARLYAWQSHTFLLHGTVHLLNCTTQLWTHATENIFFLPYTSCHAWSRLLAQQASKVSLVTTSTTMRQMQKPSRQCWRQDLCYTKCCLACSGGYLLQTLYRLIRILSLKVASMKCYVVPILTEKICQTIYMVSWGCYHICFDGTKLMKMCPVHHSQSHVNSYCACANTTKYLSSFT